LDTRYWVNNSKPVVISAAAADYFIHNCNLTFAKSVESTKPAFVKFLFLLVDFLVKI
jgi:hypothetical protein